MASGFLTSKKYIGLTAQYSYQYTTEKVSYSSYGEFNGGTPEEIVIEIRDVLIKDVSIYEFISLDVLEGLEEEIISHIY